MFEAEDNLEDFTFKINEGYAKKFEHNKKREELHRLQEKYGKDAVVEDEDSETDTDEDEDAMYDTVESDKTFLRVLSKLKNKDPEIYDEGKTWFKKLEDKGEKEEKHKPMFLKDYERETLLAKGSLVVESDDEEAPGQTYNEEQRQLKEDLKKALDEGGEEEEFLTLRDKTEEDQSKEDDDYRCWLKGEKGKVKDKNILNDCAKLREEWTDPELDNSEKFLRDFILNKGWMDKDAINKDVVPSYDEVIGEDNEEDLEEHEQFERKFNFRYEEPNADLIRNYPRTIANSVRKTDEKRKEQRKKKEERKVKEKAEKKAEIERMKRLKLEEIEDKIKRLSDNAGRNLDNLVPVLDNDFNPAEHDQMMSSLFNEEYYSEELHTKPVFSDSDGEINDEEWFSKIHEPDTSVGAVGGAASAVKTSTFIKEALGEDEEDANVIYPDEEASSKKKSWKRKRSKKFKEAVEKAKPLFNPDEQTFEKYYDEYYALDCEDIVGGTHCRFNYRQTKPSTFGLTVDEILKADDKELNQWFSLKKIVKYRTPHQEEKDERKFGNHQHNLFMKKRLLTSLEPKVEEPKKIKFAPEETKEETTEETAVETTVETTEVSCPNPEAVQSEPLKKKKKKEKSVPVVEEKPKKGKKSKTISSTRREAYGL